jgi:hypothetical protein
MLCCFLVPQKHHHGMGTGEVLLSQLHANTILEAPAWTCTYVGTWVIASQPLTASTTKWLFLTRFCYPAVSSPCLLPTPVLLQDNSTTVNPPGTSSTGGTLVNAAGGTTSGLGNVNDAAQSTQTPGNAFTSSAAVDQLAAKPQLNDAGGSNSSGNAATAEQASQRCAYTVTSLQDGGGCRRWFCTKEYAQELTWCLMWPRCCPLFVMHLASRLQTLQG